MLDVDVRDVETLAGFVSPEFGPWSPPVTVTQDTIDRFADLTGDRQWIHVDVERARRESPFGTTIAHGFLLLSLLPTLVAPREWQPVHYSSATNYGSSGLRFLAPVPAGSRIRARQRLEQVERHRRGTLLTSEVAIHANDSDKPSLLYDLQVLYLHSGAAGQS